MTDTTGQINAKRLSKTGITEELLDRIADAESGELVVVANVRFEQVHKKRDGSRKVDLTITEIEPASDQVGENHLRGVQRALFMNRKLHGEDQQLPLDSHDDVEPTVAQVVERGRQFTPHDFESVGRDDDGEWADQCEVCGNPEEHNLHHISGAEADVDEDAA